MPKLILGKRRRVGLVQFRRGRVRRMPHELLHDDPGAGVCFLACIGLISRKKTVTGIIYCF